MLVPQRNVSEDLFLTREWLDFFSNDYHLIELEHKSSKLTMAFDQKRKFGISFETCPPFTAYNALITHQHEHTTKAVRFNDSIQLYKKLLSTHFSSKIQQLKFSVQDIHLPILNDKRVEFKPSFTEIILFPNDINTIWNSFTSGLRNNILYAQEHSLIIEQTDFDEISSFLMGNNYYVYEGLKKEKLKEILVTFYHKGKLIVFGSRINNTLISCSVFLFSNNQLYVWLNYNDKNLIIRGTNQAIIWKGIKCAIVNQCSFNFDGSNKLEILKVFKEFNSQSIIYPNCYIYNNSLLKLLSKFK